MSEKHNDHAGRDSAPERNPADEKLRLLLQSWDAPAPTASLDRRLLQAYRNSGVTPVWKRMFTATIRVPAPVAAAFGVLFLSSAFLAARSLVQVRPGKQAPAPTVQSNTAVAPAVPHQDDMAALTPSSGPGPSMVSTARQRHPGRPVANTTAVTARPEITGTAKTKKKISVISVRSEEGSLQVITGGEYRLMTKPKIYAGAYFNPSNERHLP